jgi:hypothetical protein
MTLNLVDPLDTERRELAWLTRKGVGMPMAGLLYWLGMAVMLRVLPQRTALVAAFVLTGLVFPVGAALTRLAGGNLFARSRVLTPLAVQLAALQLFYWPVAIVVFRTQPEWTPFTLAILFGSHFLPYAWLYQSPGYRFLAVSIGVVVTAAVLIMRDPLYLTIPILTAACYAIAVLMVRRELAAAPLPRFASYGR